MPYIKLAESQKIGKPNNLKVFGNKKTKGLQHDGQKQQNNHDPSVSLVLNATFNNISVILVLLVEDTGVPGENHRPATCHRQALSQNVVSRASRHERG